MATEVQRQGSDLPGASVSVREEPVAIFCFVSMGCSCIKEPTCPSTPTLSFFLFFETVHQYERTSPARIGLRILILFFFWCRMALFICFMLFRLLEKTLQRHFGSAAACEVFKHVSALWSVKRRAELLLEKSVSSQTRLDLLEVALGN